MRVLLVGGGAREHAIAEALAKSKPTPDIFGWMKKICNPCIAALAARVNIGYDYQEIFNFARECQPDLAIIGPDEPLYYGVANALADMCLYGTVAD